MSKNWRTFYADQMVNMAQDLLDKADRARVAGHRNMNARAAYLDAESYEKEATDLRKAAGFLRRRESEESGSR